MADLTRLVDSADCATSGCPNEADGRDGLCRMCRTVPSRRTLLAPKPGALAHLIARATRTLITRKEDTA